MGVSVEDCLLIGDRDDRDGECARRAGMKYFILD
ncbi:HAD hydrolase-like protein [Richelia intracellularis]|nr:HAD hydrolase-like protein [Richelia intracellularis]